MMVKRLFSLLPSANEFSGRQCFYRCLPVHVVDGWVSGCVCPGTGDGVGMSGGWWVCPEGCVYPMSYGIPTPPGHGT